MPLNRNNRRQTVHTTVDRLSQSHFRRRTFEIAILPSSNSNLKLTGNQSLKSRFRRMLQPDLRSKTGKNLMLTLRPSEKARLTKMRLLLVL